MKYKGAYSAEITYDVGDVVIYTDGLVYHLQKPADAGTPPHNTRYWEMLDKTLAEAVLLIADAQMGTIEDGSITTEKLDSALQNELVRDRASDESLWESGGISSSNGTNSSGSTRIRTKTYLGSNILSVSVASGYKYIVAVYESDVYKGMWNGSSLQKARHGVPIKQPSQTLGTINSGWSLPIPLIPPFPRLPERTAPLPECSPRQMWIA